MLKIYNSLTRTKQEFKTITPGKIGMYVCGVTVYDLCHIGHARTFVNFDVIVRYLRYAGYEVKYVRNITDIDDKIIKRANERGISAHDLAEQFIVEMHKDFDALNIKRPDIEPKATDNITEIVNFVQKLIDNQHAYVAENGDVLFDINSFKEYGKLSGQKLDELQAGARIEVEKSKHNPLDFVLWKMSKPGEPSWESPWGAGRPGWHIECSAMNNKYLGKEFDIHGGGSDLIFPHHENEIAQSCCANKTPYVHYWMHSGMVMINEEKMSKSLNNFFTIRDVLETYDAETIRFFLLSGQYRSPLNYSQENLDKARAALNELKEQIKDYIKDSETLRQENDALKSEIEKLKSEKAELLKSKKTLIASSVEIKKTTEKTEEIEIEIDSDDDLSFDFDEDDDNTEIEDEEDIIDIPVNKDEKTEPVAVAPAISTEKKTDKKRHSHEHKNPFKERFMKQQNEQKGYTPIRQYSLFDETDE